MPIEKNDELLSDFDFDKSDTKPIRLDDSYQQMELTVTLDSDVADDFPSSESVNHALRFLSRITKQYKAELTTK